MEEDAGNEEQLSEEQCGGGCQCPPTSLRPFPFRVPWPASRACVCSALPEGAAALPVHAAGCEQPSTNDPHPSDGVILKCVLDRNH